MAPVLQTRKLEHSEVPAVLPQLMTVEWEGHSGEMASELVPFTAMVRYGCQYFSANSPFNADFFFKGLYIMSIKWKAM